MAAQVALKRQQAAEDAIAMGLRACSSDDSLPILSPGPLWGPGTVIPPRTDAARDDEEDADGDAADEDLGKCNIFYLH